MKNIIIIFVLLGSSYNFLSGQSSYGLFEWDVVRVGLVVPSGDQISGGIAFSTEPRFNISDNFSASARLEFAFFGAEEINGSTTDVSISASTALIGDYYLNTTSSNRPFLGLGVGSFGSGTITVTDGSGQETEFDNGTSIGIIPRVGYEFGHLRLSVEYNLLFKEGASNYLGLHVAATLWGKNNR
jgi:hypothetical protein